jgi:uncharacterized protein YcbX
MPNTIESIYRYPIKGLSGEPVDRIALTAGSVIPGEREYALARSNVEFDPANPQYFEKTHFLSLVRDKKLAELTTKFNNTSNKLSISRRGSVLIEVSLTSPRDCKRIADFFVEYLNMPAIKQPHIVRAIHGTKNHSFSDVPDKAISFINLSSIIEFSKKVGMEIDPMRFRGNVNFTNNIPWEEFNWVDKKIRIGGAVLNIFKRTKRCAATNVNPFSAVYDINIPKELNYHYRHMDMGVYAIVLKSGLIAVGDEIELI